ncbi:hypothetical protein, partial [Leisingera daeponensis]|uniref:hypothetical protein n=1 Tax=Leisingera daeponensis TaxID=405746 RepID=UPI001AD7EA6E
ILAVWKRFLASCGYLALSSDAAVPAGTFAAAGSMPHKCGRPCWLFGSGFWPAVAIWPFQVIRLFRPELWWSSDPSRRGSVIPAVWKQFLAGCGHRSFSSDTAVPAGTFAAAGRMPHKCGSVMPAVQKRFLASCGYLALSGDTAVPVGTLVAI